MSSLISCCKMWSLPLIVAMLSERHSSCHDQYTYIERGRERGRAGGREGDTLQ